MTTLTFPGGYGVNFLARVVRAGDRYGLDMKLVHDGLSPLVEFYDVRVPAVTDQDGKVLGQFVDRFALGALCGTLYSEKRELTKNGLKIGGRHNVDWKINGAGMRSVLEWLREVL